MYGTIRAEDYLERLGARDVDWRFYETMFERAYGERPPVRDILERHRAGDPEAREAFRRLFVFGDADAGNFERFQAKFNLLINGSEMMNAASGKHADPVPPLADEIDFFITRMLADQRRQGIAYAEQRMMFGPPFTRGADAAPLARDPRALRARRRASGFQARLAFSLPRRDPWPDFELVRELALGPYGESVTGVDFCYVEEGFPPKDKREFFAAVHEFNERHPERALAILYHVGESFTDKSLESAVRWVHEAAAFGAHRLGHAIALGVDPEVYGAHERARVGRRAPRPDRLRPGARRGPARARRARGRERARARARSRCARCPRERTSRTSTTRARLADVRARQEFAMARVRATGAVVEVCPTSNLRIGGIADPLHHPVHRFIDAGVPFVVASDDPGIFDTTVRDELDWVAREARPRAGRGRRAGRARVELAQRSALRTRGARPRRARTPRVDCGA